MEGELGRGLLICTPYEDNHVMMADSVLEVGDGNCVNLIVENYGLEPAHLRKGTILGEIAEVEEVLGDQTLAVQESTSGEEAQSEREQRAG